MKTILLSLLFVTSLPITSNAINGNVENKYNSDFISTLTAFTGGDGCTSATIIGCGGFETGDTSGFTDTGGANSFPDEWYVFEANGNREQVFVDLTSGNESVLTVYEGSCGGLTLVDSQVTNFGYAGISFESNGTSDYYWVVEGNTASGSGVYNLSSFCQEIPGDSCSAPKNLFCDSVSTGNTMNNTDTGGENASPEEWFVYFGSSRLKIITVSLCGVDTDFDSLLTVYASNDCSGFTTVATSDNDCGDDGEITFTTEPNQTYYVVVEGATATDVGNYSLSVSCEDTGGEDCNSAVPLICGIPVNANTLSSTDNGGLTSAPDQWFQYRSFDNPELVTLSLCNNTDFDSSIAVYVGFCGGPLLVSNDNTCGDDAEVVFATIPNGVYYIVVEGATSTDVGNYSLSASCVNTGADSCGSAVSTFCGATIEGNTTIGTDTGGQNASPDNWIGYFPRSEEQSQIITLSLCGGTDFDSLLSVYEGSCGSLNLIASSDNDCGDDGELTFTALGGDVADYYFVVEGATASDAGYYTLSITGCTPIPGDFCRTALPVFTGSVISAETSTSTDQGGESAAPDNWFVYYSSGVAENLKFSLCDPATDFDSSIAIYEGVFCFNPLNLVASNDSFCGNNAEITFTTGTNFETYFIVVEGATNSDFGNYTLSVSNATLSTDAFELENAIEFYPNPANTIVNIKSQGLITGIDIFNMIGQKVISRKINSNIIELNVDTLVSGTYFMKVSSRDSSSIHKILIN
ncbi:T9SS type A sorting domain-containing protein [Flavivirga amylovorans]|uniref:T9SS type A sorting domain-containing protein n=1 Tax=Flavivirga amylovorans TaxID=870486 RepID=A0ABT8WVV1_9FLAO|nr:T9SS type A sorting domain-containing protein [Flavivirga amylovorans]MDO5985791.1 T9SS type A sorting domain-containing protein [Flavivirga amylovorans]